MKPLLAAALLLAATAPALADAVTYEGHLGDSTIGVEFAEDPGEAPVFGRYFYARKGIDIPLHGMDRDVHWFTVQEERPCTLDTCSTDEDGNISELPDLGPVWQLARAEDGKTLLGTWTDGTTTLPVQLTPIGSRPFAIMPESTISQLVEAASYLGRNGDLLTPDISPYETLKMRALGRLAESEAIDMAGSQFNYVTDPRTELAFPRVIALADGSDTDPINASLEARHWAMNADALQCAGMQYPALGWAEWNAYAAGTLGGYEGELIAVNYLSPTVLSYTQSGSLFCGGAHPFNHISTINLDVETGAPLDLSRIFTFWMPMQGGIVVEDVDAARANPGDFVWGPEPVFVDFLREKRTRSTDATFEEECGIDDLIPEYLSVGFREGDRVVFSLGTLPHAIQACADELYEAPIAELMEWLAPTAAAYFPSLLK